MQSPEIPKPKTERSLAQMEALNRARVKAQEVRRANADLKLKEKVIAKAEKEQKASEINRKYQEVAKATAAPEEPAPTPPEVQVGEEEEIVYEKAPKKKRRVVVVQESDSEEEEIEVVLPKKKAKAPPIEREEEPPPRRPPNPFLDRPFIPSIIPY
tara:strand:- start:478 stop:945 length:468 start_codon:yes stop_codon:yes gene_type:complete